MVPHGGGSRTPRPRGPGPADHDPAGRIRSLAVQVAAQVHSAGPFPLQPVLMEAPGSSTMMRTSRGSSRRLLHAAARSAAALALAAAAASAQGSANGAPLRVLFIGNSYIYVNDLPSVVGDLATAAGEKRRFAAEGVLVGGASLERHLAQGDALKAIARGGWDVVIIQEQSMRPIDAPALMWRDAQKFGDAVKQAGARLVFYETWAREATPALQDSLSHVYHRAAELTGGNLA